MICDGSLNADSLIYHNPDSITLEEVFDAYYACRKHKRASRSASLFESDFETYCMNLCTSINAGTYYPNPYHAFVVTKPVPREIFAADFSDRVVHHLLVDKIQPMVEKRFIYDSYACRKGKGTLFGIRRVERFLRSCSENYTKDCYILKLDISGFFLHINKQLLYNQLERAVLPYLTESEQIYMQLELAEKIIFHDPTRKCVIYGNRSNWQLIHPSKSLFHAKNGYGLPIGNLTSQLFANLYLNCFDHYMKHDVGIKYYGRYVDDIICLHKDRSFLQKVIKKAESFLMKELELELNPKKNYLQPYTHGVAFLGAVIKPHRTTVSRRIRTHLYQSLQRHNEHVLYGPPSKEKKQHVMSSMNSYLGLMKQHNTYSMRKRMITFHLHEQWYRQIDISSDYGKVSLRNTSKA